VGRAPAAGLGLSHRSGLLSAEDELHVMWPGRSRWTICGEGTITIVRDAHGVPHVRASSESDLYRGLGYCHGVDRALQMLLVRILAQGRGSECLDASEEMLRLDRFFRRLGLGGDATAEVAKIPAADHALAEAYCDGVNRALARRMPWELRLAGYRPEPWTLADSVVTSRVIGYVALAQSQGDMERLLVEMVQGGVPRGHLEALFPGLLRDLDIELVRKLRLGERLVPEGMRWSGTLPRAVASNNWVVAGRKTASGSALLANDPHLEGNRRPSGTRWCLSWVRASASPQPCRASPARCSAVPTTSPGARPTPSWTPSTPGSRIVGTAATGAQWMGERAGSPSACVPRSSSANTSRTSL